MQAGIGGWSQDLCRGLAMLGTSGLTIIKRYKSSELPAEAKDEHLILDGALLTSAIFIFWPMRTLTPVVYSTNSSPFPVAYSLSMFNSRSVAMASQAAGMSASLTLPWFARTLPILTKLLVNIATELMFPPPIFEAASPKLVFLGAASLSRSLMLLTLIVAAV